MSTVFAFNDDSSNNMHPTSSSKYTGKCVPVVKIDTSTKEIPSQPASQTSSTSHNITGNSTTNYRPSLPFLQGSALKLSPQRCMPSFSRSPISPTTKMHFKDLPQEIKGVDSKDLESFIKSIPSHTLSIIDIRPYNLYSNSRIQNAVNLCVPTTLLKRESYALPQVLGSLDNSEDILSQSGSVDTILIYDNESSSDHVSFSLYQTCLKFHKFTSKKLNVYFLNGGLQEVDKNSTQVENYPVGSSPVSSTSTTSNYSISSGSTSSSSPLSAAPPIASGHHLASMSPVSPPDNNSQSTTTGGGSSGCKNISLSGFSLPSSAPSHQKFLSSIKRNNLPKLDLTNISGKRFKEDSKHPSQGHGKGNDDDLNDYNYQFKYPSKLSDRKDLSDKLPKWLQFISRVQNNKELSPEQKNKETLKLINKKFNKIEKAEQARLRKAIAFENSGNNNPTPSSSSEKTSPFLGVPNPSLHSPNICSPSALCPGCDKVVYKIPKGIEYGYKNRYNNIWPYEHSRVKLNANSPSCTTPSALCKHSPKEYDDYFNANYITFKEVSNYQYIATQNPLQATYEDFWKTIWYNNINIIVCLNKQLSANLAGQDLKYFDNQTFKESNIKIERVAIEENDVFILRTIQITKKDIFNSYVYHMEFKNWPDFGVPSSFGSILELINFKNKLIAEKDLNPKLLVHCSAGCGRTGCFITLDMILDCFKAANGQGASQKSDEIFEFDPWGEDDLIYKTVQFQRKQRISMVQNLDQFIVCYEIILDYIASTL